MTDALDFPGETFKYLAIDFTKLFSLLNPSVPTAVDESMRKTMSTLRLAGFGSGKKSRTMKEKKDYLRKLVSHQKASFVGSP